MALFTARMDLLYDDQDIGTTFPGQESGESRDPDVGVHGAYHPEHFSSTVCLNTVLETPCIKSEIDLYNYFKAKIDMGILVNIQSIFRLF